MGTGGHRVTMKLVLNTWLAALGEGIAEVAVLARSLNVALDDVSTRLGSTALMHHGRFRSWTRSSTTHSVQTFHSRWRPRICTWLWRRQTAPTNAYRWRKQLRSNGTALCTLA